MHNLPPIQPIHIETQKTIPMKQIPLREQPTEDDQECLFFKLPCTTKSQQNKQTLNNEKSSLNQAQIELSQTKNLTLKALPLQIPLNTHTFTEKTHQKGIRLSMGSKRRPLNLLNKTQIETETQINRIHQTQSSNAPQINIAFFQRIERRDITFHQLNPLSIDRSKYDMTNLKLGGNKGTPQSRISFNYSHQIFGSNNSNWTYKNIPTTINKTHIVLNSSNPLPTLPIPTQPYHYNYQNNSSYIQNQKFFKTVRPNPINRDKIQTNNQSLTQQHFPHDSKVRYELTSIPIYRCKTQHFEHDSGCTKYNESTHYQGHNTSLNEHSYYEQTQQYFNNIQIPNHKKNDLENSTYSTYSQKYRKYMEKELVLPSQTVYQPEINEMVELMENVRIEVDSVNQEHNQKNQINFTPHLPKTNLNERRQQRKGSYSSSFMVIESKQKQIQSTRKIYLQSNIDTYSIPESGLIHQLDQFMIQDSQTHQNLKSENQCISICEIQQLNQLQHDVDTLCKTFNNLCTEEEILNHQNEQLCSLKMHELQQEIKSLETLKQISQQRCQQIDYLRQMLKVKLIQNNFNRSPSLKEKYLKDEKGWEKYICYIGESPYLNQSNQTNHTQN